MIRFLVWVALLAATCPALAGEIVVPARNEEARAPGERAPQMWVVNTPAPWLRKAEYAGVVYLLYAFPSRIERYSLLTNTWLPPIVLSAAPRGFGVSAAGIFVSQNNRVSRFELDGSSETVLPQDVWVNATDFAVLGDYLLTVRNREIQSVRISDYSQVAVYGSIGGYYTPDRIAVSSQAGLIFGWQVGLSPSDILKIPLNEDGTFGAYLSSPYHGDYPAGQVVFPDPSGQYIVDDSGIVFRGGDLTYRSATGGPANDAIVVGTDRYVLHSDYVVRLDSAMREVGLVELGEEAHAVAASGDRIYLFRSGPTVEVLSVGQFTAPSVGTAPDPQAVPFTVDYVDLSDNGVLHLFNKAQRVVHRFSIPQWTYLPSVALPLTPVFAGVDRAGSRVYVAYSNGRLGVVDSGANHESFLAYAPSTPIGLGAADDLVMVADYTGAWESHRIFNSAGVETDWVDWNYYSREYAWNRANRRMYFFRDGSSPNDLHFEELSAAGVITAEGETPYHGTVQADLPIRPSPSGAYVYLGSGQVFDGINLSLVGTLPLPPRDLAWIGNTLYSLHPAAQAGPTRMVRWTQSNTISAEGVFAGEPARVFHYAGQIITVSRGGMRTTINRWPASLNGTNVSTLMTDMSPPAAPGAPVSFTVLVTNQGFGAAGSVTLAVTLSAPVNQLTWLCDGPQGSIPCGTPTGLEVSAPLEPGQSLQASAFGFMSTSNPDSVGVVATSTFAGDIDPADDVATGTIAFQNLVFGSGFE